MTASVWGKIEKPEVSLQEIMCEQVTEYLVEKKESRMVEKFRNPEESLKDKEYQQDSPKNIQSVWNDENDQESIHPNFEVAKVPQTQLEDEDYNKCHEGSDKPEYVDPYSDYDDESYDEDLGENINWNWFEFVEENLGLMPSMLRYNVNLTSKESEEINKNRVNILPSHANKSTHICSRIERSRRYNTYYRKTTDFGFDKYTTKLLDKMIQNNILEGLRCEIYVGKHAKYYHTFISAKCRHIQVPEQCVVKVFQTTPSDCENQDSIIERNSHSKTLNRNINQVRRNRAQFWAEREMVNLCRLKKFGIPCPDVIMLKDNILVTSFIGRDYCKARPIKDGLKDRDDYVTAFNQIVAMLRNLYQDANLIHGRLSEDNILWHNRQCYFVGLGRAVNIFHKKAFRLLYNDCKYIVKFFKEYMYYLPVPEKLHEIIVGRNYDFLKQISKKSTSKYNRCLPMDRFQAKTIEKYENLAKLLLEKK